MGKVTGFMEFERVNETYEAPAKRLHHYKEFVVALTDEEAKVQGAVAWTAVFRFAITVPSKQHHS